MEAVGQRAESMEAVELIDCLTWIRERETARLRREVTENTILSWQICSQVAAMMGAGEDYPALTDVLGQSDSGSDAGESRADALADEARRGLEVARRAIAMDNNS